MATAAALAARDARVVSAHWPRRTLPFLQRVAREATRLAPGRILFLTAGEGEEGAFLLAAGEASGADPAALGRGVAAILQARGGGSGRVFQGKAQALSRRDEAETFLHQETRHDA